jgi:hypothetical protein
MGAANRLTSARQHHGEVDLRVEDDDLLAGGERVQVDSELSQVGTFRHEA